MYYMIVLQEGSNVWKYLDPTNFHGTLVVHVKDFLQFWKMIRALSLLSL